MMIICEVGLNHMGSIKYANEYINKIIRLKIDGIIFHLREKTFYQQRAGSKFLLPDDFYFKISKKLKKNKIKFGMAVVEPDSIDFCEKINVDFYKIFGDDIGNIKLLNKIKKTKKKTFVSTGTAGLSEIRKFVKHIVGCKQKFTLIHTQLNYDIEVVNLKAIPLLKEKFGLPVSYGNHASNIKVIYLALVYEPSDILFYVKGNKVKKHVDEPHAVRLDELPALVNDLYDLPKSIGSGKKIKMNNQT